ncbi:MAG TPA: Uma2 family endonuclease [Gemmataceae bacterium]|nr:Uma2 family endonuclease [Gemmataceae bacterium]
MSTVLSPSRNVCTLADLLVQLGGIPASHVLLHPSPGQATEADVVDLEQRENRLCELVDGVLVEKATGYRESLLAGLMATLLDDFVRPRNLGLVTGADGMVRLFPGLVRIPDVASASWARIPNGCVPTEPIPHLVPDLAVEVLSKSNTAAELTRKCGEYFAAGVRMVWLVDPEGRTVTVYTVPDQSTMLDETQMLDGSPILPGYSLSLRELFAELDRHGNG